MLTPNIYPENCHPYNKAKVVLKRDSDGDIIESQLFDNLTDAVLFAKDFGKHRQTLVAGLARRPNHGR